MCPLCILAAISLGGGSAVAGGLHWIKEKIAGDETRVDGCQSLCLSRATAFDPAERPAQSSEQKIVPEKKG